MLQISTAENDKIATLFELLNFEIGWTFVILRGMRALETLRHCHDPNCVTNTES